MKILEQRRQPDGIEVETDTYCNRTCHYCPNGHSSRGRQRTPISDEVWTAVMTDLERHRFSGQFAFHNYNEPLADERIFTLIEHARAAIPDARLVIYTNGDYRRKGEMERLVDLGVGTVRITLHPNAQDKNPLQGSAAVRAFTEDCFPGSSPVRIESSKGHEEQITLGGTNFVVFVPEIKRFTNRAMAVPIGLPFSRHSPCLLPSFNAAVDVWGNLKLCAQIYDVLPPAEAPYKIGNVLEEPLMQLWAGERMNALRRKVAAGSYEDLPRCAGCDQRLRPDLVPRAKEIHSALMELEPFSVVSGEGE
ncbi:SPASM domain-containing protein [Streptomyces tendae]|uniref:SPASM domain-containing protein n=1 Tax=Streptomyces tendae TaxID=1932 RepID=UPI0036760E9D